MPEQLRDRELINSNPCPPRSRLVAQPAQPELRNLGSLQNRGPGALDPRAEQSFASTALIRLAGRFCTRVDWSGSRRSWKTSASSPSPLLHILFERIELGTSALGVIRPVRVDVRDFEIRDGLCAVEFRFLIIDPDVVEPLVCVLVQNVDLDKCLLLVLPAMHSLPA